MDHARSNSYHDGYLTDSHSWVRPFSVWFCDQNFIIFRFPNFFHAQFLCKFVEIAGLILKMTFDCFIGAVNVEKYIYPHSIS